MNIHDFFLLPNNIIIGSTYTDAEKRSGVQDQMKK